MADSVIGSLAVRIGADASELVREMKKGEDSVKDLKDGYEAAVRSAKVFAAAAAAVGAALAAATKLALNNADAMYKASQSAGVTTETFSELAYAGKLADVSTEQLSTALSRLNRNMVDAASGTGDAVRAFDALGIEVKNADGSMKNADRIMEEVADKFADMEDGAGKSAIAMMMFGRAGAQMIPMLNAGSKGLREMREEARALGVSMDTETAKAAEHFNDQITRIGQVGAGMANSLMRELLPSITAIADEMVKAAKGTKGFKDEIETVADGLKSSVLVVFQTLAVLGSDVAFVFDSMGKGIGVAAARLAAIAKLDFKAFDSIGEEFQKDLEASRAKLDAFQKKVMEIQAGGPVINENFVGDLPLASDVAKSKAPGVGDAGQEKRIINARMKAIEEFNAWQQEVMAEIVTVDQQNSDERLANHTAYAENRRAIALSLFDLEYQLLQETINADYEATNAKLGNLLKLRDELKTDEELEIERYDRQRERLKEFSEEQLEIIGGRNEVEARMKQEHEDRMARIEGQGWEVKKRHRQLDLSAAKTFLGNMSGLMQSNSKKLFEIGKTAAIAETVINTYKAAMGAYSALASIPIVGPALGAAAAAAAIATGMAQVSAIRAQSFGGGGSAAAPVAAANPNTGLPAGSPGGNVGGVGGGGQAKIIHINGETFSRKQLRSLVEELNEDGRDGGRIFLAD